MSVGSSPNQTAVDFYKLKPKGRMSSIFSQKKQPNHDLQADNLLSYFSEALHSLKKPRPKHMLNNAGVSEFTVNQSQMS